MRSLSKHFAGMVVLLSLSLPIWEGLAQTQPGAQPQAQPSRYQGEPITLDLVDVSLVDFFRTISELSGLNILIDPDVLGQITIHVEEVPWDQLFDMVLKSHQLEKIIEGNMVRISTKTALQREEEAKEKLKKAALLAADTVTVTKRLNYAVAAEIVTSLKNQLTLERGQMDVDSRTNTLIITDIPASVERINTLVDSLDVPERQVEIEARIIEATTNFARQLGVELGLQIGKITDRVQGQAAVAASFDGPVGLGRLVVGKVLDTVRLDAIIGAAETQGEARILSKPRVSAQNNAEAIITQGARIPIPVQQNFTTTVRFETAALQLTVTPRVTDKDTVLLNIHLENNVPDFSRTVLGIPTILTSESRTQVLVDDGGTSVIGGIYVEVDRQQENRVPGLGSIPLLGYLFKNSQLEKETREILFFITPNIKK